MPSLRLQQLRTRHVGPIELSVDSGECICIHGASGSGKTLLLRAIADLDEHTGEAYLDAQRCSLLPAPDWRRSVALVGAESHWWGECVGEHFETAINAGWLKQLGLPEEAVNWQLSRCSTGERQRLALLRTLMQNPAALLLDEPTGNLDQDSTLRVEELLAEYRRQRHSAVLWVSHDSGQIERVAQRRFNLRDGGLVEEEEGVGLPCR